MTANQISTDTVVPRRVEWFLADQRRAGVVVDRAEFFSTEERDGIVVATVTADRLGAVTTPSSDGSRFRSAAFELAKECAATGKDLILDLSAVRYLNMESVFTLDDMKDLLAGAKREFVISGVNELPSETLRRSRSSLGASTTEQATATGNDEALALLRSRRES